MKADANNKAKSVKIPRRKYMDRILQLMDEHGDNEFDLADRLGVTRNVVANWLAPRSKLDIDNLIKIANVYDETTDYVLGVSSARKKHASVAAIEAATGLTENAISSVSYYHEIERYSIDALNDLLDFPDYWSAISHHLSLAVSSLRIHKNNAAEGAASRAAQLTVLQDVISQVGAENFLSNDSMPNIPKGTLLISARDACNVYKSMAVDVFKMFLDNYIDKASDGGDNHGKH